MTQHRTDHAELLDALLERVDQLRASGVTRVELDGLVVDIAPPVQEIVIPEDDALDDIDPLNDRDTFGGPVPSLRRGRR